MAACLLLATLAGFVYMQENDIVLTHFVYIYAIYRRAILPLDIKVNLCLNTEQTEDSWSLKVLAP